MSQPGTLDHPPIALDVINIVGTARIAQLTTSAAAAQTAALPEGIYAVWASVDTNIKVATTANDVTVATGYLIRANTTVKVFVPALHKIGAIAGGAGVLDAQMVG